MKYPEFKFSALLKLCVSDLETPSIHGIVERVVLWISFTHFIEKNKNQWRKS